MTTMHRRSMLTILAAALAGCVAYYPAPGPGGFDRSWDAALGAATDVGVAVTVADRGAGRIRGSRAGHELSINVISQADASVRVEITAPTSSPLADQVTAAYNRRMGR